MRSQTVPGWCLSEPRRQSGYSGAPPSASTPLWASCGGVCVPPRVPPLPALQPTHTRGRKRRGSWTPSPSSSTQLPPRTRHLQQQLRLLRDEAVRYACEGPDAADVPFTLQELVRSRRRGRDTAPGTNGMTYSMLAHVVPAGDAALLSLFNASWLAGRLPPAWKEADIQPIPKTREPTKLRPISLTSCAAKTAERMVLSRLQWRVNALQPPVFGFTRGLSTADSIITLLTRVNHRPTVAVFLDLEKAFELASPHAILAALAGKGVRGRLLAWLRDYNKHRCARVKFQGHKSSFHELENGTPQSGILSTFVFNLLMEQLVDLPFQEGTVLLSYADVLALVVTGRGNHLSWAQRALDLITARCEELSLKISAEKSRAMAIRGATPADRMSVQGIGLAWTGCYQYFGVWLDLRLSFGAQLTYLRERTQARLNVMRAMTCPGAVVTYDVLRLYYMQVVRSLVDYSAPVLTSLSPS